MELEVVIQTEQFNEVLVNLLAESRNKASLF